MTELFDLAHATPAGRETADYAVSLLGSTHLPEVAAAERWLTTHPHESRAVLEQALAGTSAQPAAVLLGNLGGDESIDALVAAHGRGGEGLRAAVQRGLRLIGSDAALAAVAALTITGAADEEPHEGIGQGIG